MESPPKPCAGATLCRHRSKFDDFRSRNSQSSFALSIAPRVPMSPGWTSPVGDFFFAFGQGMSQNVKRPFDYPSRVVNVGEICPQQLFVALSMVRRSHRKKANESSERYRRKTRPSVVSRHPLHPLQAIPEPGRCVRSSFDESGGSRREAIVHWGDIRQPPRCLLQPGPDKRSPCPNCPEERWAPLRPTRPSKSFDSNLDSTGRSQPRFNIAQQD